MDDEEELTEAEQAELHAVGQGILDTVFPFLDSLDAEHPNVDAKFIAFTQLIHAMFEVGWTAEELISEVQDHHEFWLANSDQQGSS